MPSKDARSIQRATVVIPLPKEVIGMATAEMCMLSILSGCNRPGDRRGLCDTDYQVIYDLVRNRVITFEEAEAAGLCKAPRRQTQKRILRAILARRAS